MRVADDIIADFCRNRGYSRKNLYFRVLLIVVFCMAVKVDTQKENRFHLFNLVGGCVITITDLCGDNSIAMTSLNDNLRFECAFSQSAVRNNTIVVVIMSLLVIIPFGYLGIKLGGWIGIILVLLFVGLSVYSLVYTNRLTHESYLEITEEGLLKCNYKGRATVSFPIKEITSIESASLAQANQRYATVPVVLNSRGWELYPSEGVLITFNRKWIKSVFPVFFNPADIQGFISAVKRAKDSLNT